LYMTICTVYWSRPYALSVGYNLKRSSSLAHHLEQATSHASHLHIVSAQAQTDTQCRRAIWYAGPKVMAQPNVHNGLAYIIQSISLRTLSFRPCPDGSNSPGAKFHLYLPPRSIGVGLRGSERHLLEIPCPQRPLSGVTDGVSFSRWHDYTRLVASKLYHERERERERERESERAASHTYIRPEIREEWKKRGEGEQLPLPPACRYKKDRSGGHRRRPIHPPCPSLPENQKATHLPRSVPSSPPPSAPVPSCTHCNLRPSLRFLFSSVAISSVVACSSPTFSLRCTVLVQRRSLFPLLDHLCACFSLWSVGEEAKNCIMPLALSLSLSCCLYRNHERAGWSSFWRRRADRPTVSLWLLMLQAGEGPWTTPSSA
jgi:hypothetical protein